MKKVELLSDQYPHIYFILQIYRMIDRSSRYLSYSWKGKIRRNLQKILSISNDSIALVTLQRYEQKLEAIINSLGRVESEQDRVGGRLESKSNELTTDGEGGPCPVMRNGISMRMNIFGRANRIMSLRLDRIRITN